MKILIIDIDSKIPNLALKKIEKYHLDKGDEVIWNNELMAYSVDKIYVSCIFTKNRNKAKYWEMFDNSIIGGTGYDLKVKLTKEIEKVKPKINWGFTTRGCIRNCDFCFVPEKEGKIRAVADIYDIWDGESKDIILMDNNILGLKKHFFKICDQLKKENLRVDFNQGLDVRVLTDKMAKYLKELKTREIRFAFDDIKLKDIILDKLKILNKYNIRGLWYILVGFNSTIEEDIERVRILVNNNQRPYIMRHENCKKDKRYIALSSWANNPRFGRGTIPWKKFLQYTEYGKRYKKYFKGEEE